jgi:hypothetical protein
MITADDLSDRRYILKHEDDYVERIDSTGLETVQIHFVFTKDRANARVFTHQDLYWKQATNPVGIAFASGFSRGEVIRVDSESSPTETLYARSVRESSPKEGLDQDIERFARDLIASTAPTRESLNTALAQLRAHKPVVGRSKLIVELCLKLGEE